jgi:hypothetical protein
VWLVLAFRQQADSVQQLMPQLEQKRPKLKICDIEKRKIE